MSKKKNIAIIGLGNIGSYFYKYVNSNKKKIFNKTNSIPNILFVSAKSKNKKRKFLISKKKWLNKKAILRLLMDNKFETAGIIASISFYFIKYKYSVNND